MVKSVRQQWKMKSEDLVFCHNDLSTNNVIVDPKTLKVNAIIDDVDAMVEKRASKLRSSKQTKINQSLSSHCIQFNKNILLSVFSI